MSYSGFDAFHRPGTITYPNGQTAVYTFDHEGQNSLTNSGTSLVTNIRTNARGQLTFLDRTNGGADITYLYHPTADVSGGGYGDSNFRLKTIQHGAAGGGDTWPDFTYEYDKVGNISKMTTTSTAGTDTQTFTYDHLNRLTDAVATGGVANYIHNTPTTDYDYDKLGNIVYFGDTTQYDYATWDTAGCSAPYPSQPMPQAIKQIDDEYYCYDKNGNMTKRYDGTTAYTQNFNVENELSSVVVGSSTTSFTYDASGIRVKTVQPNGTIIDYPFPGYEVQNPGANQTVRLTFSIAGQAVALRVIGASNLYYHLYNDHLGSLAAMSNSGGSLVSGSRAYYAPFGDYRGTAPSQTLTDIGFTGHKSNNQPGANDLGLIYMNARYYSVNTGRFISADTLVPNPNNPQSYNRYSYVYNNPLRYTDPSGYFCYDATTNEFSDGDCYDADQQVLLDYFIQLIELGLTDLEIAEKLIQASLRQISDPVAALRAISEIVRASAQAPGTFGWEYTRSQFYYEDELKKRGITWNFDDSGFGDLAEPNPAEANQITHFIGIAYISAFESRAHPSASGVVMSILVRGNEWQHLGEQSARKTDIEIDLGNIATEMGRALVTNEAPFISGVSWYAQPNRSEVSQAIMAIQNYSYADTHPIQNWVDSVTWPWE